MKKSLCLFICFILAVMTLVGCSNTTADKDKVNVGNSDTKVADKGEVSEEKDIADRNMVSNILEYVQGMAEVKSYSLFSKQNKKLDDSIKQASKVNVDMELKLLPAMGLQSLVTKLTGVVSKRTQLDMLPKEIIADTNKELETIDEELKESEGLFMEPV